QELAVVELAEAGNEERENRGDAGVGGEAVIHDAAILRTCQPPRNGGGYRVSGRGWNAAGSLADRAPPWCRGPARCARRPRPAQRSPAPGSARSPVARAMSRSLRRRRAPSL